MSSDFSKMKPGYFINDHWAPAARNLYNNEEVPDRTSHLNLKFRWLAHQLGLHEEYMLMLDGDNKIINKDMADLLAKLAGPDGHTLLKVYRIQRGLE